MELVAVDGYVESGGMDDNDRGPLFHPCGQRHEF